MSAHTRPEVCPNCDQRLPAETALQVAYCPGCGQEAVLHAASMREFIHEFIGHYVALEGPLWRSLWALLFQPGRLTLEYFAGRRRRFVQPLRLYLSLSFVFFIALHLVGHHGVQWNRPDHVQVRDCGAPGSDCHWLERELGRVGQRLASAEPGDIQAKLDKYSPYALLLMQPAFAALLALMLRSRRMKYAEHFVFSLHVHAFWFAAYLLAQAAMWLPLIVYPLMGLYGLLALKRVYRLGWWGSVWRSALLSLVYPVMLGFGTVVLVVAVLAASGGH